MNTHKLYADGSFVTDFVSWEACRLEAKERSEHNPNVRYVAVPRRDLHANSVAFLNGRKHARVIDADGSVLWIAK